MVPLLYIYCSYSNNLPVLDQNFSLVVDWNTVLLLISSHILMVHWDRYPQWVILFFSTLICLRMYQYCWGNCNIDHLQNCGSIPLIPLHGKLHMEGCFRVKYCTDKSFFIYRQHVEDENKSVRKNVKFYCCRLSVFCNSRRLCCKRYINYLGANIVPCVLGGHSDAL